MSNYEEFVSVLRDECPDLHISTDLASRVALSTDNSIYEVIPEVVIFPETYDQVVVLMEVLAKQAFRDIALYPRGGGSGANGQSLGKGVMLDFTRYMNRIIDFNEKTGCVRVQSGVIADVLQKALHEKGYYLPCLISSSSRASIGGMVGTNAAGKGRCHGRMVDHVVSMTQVLQGGKMISPQEMSLSQAKKSNIADEVVALTGLLEKHQEAIQKFPQNPRSYCGYDIRHVYDVSTQTFNLIPLFCGSEGTLGVTVEVVLQTQKIPAARMLALVAYPSLEAALQHGKSLSKDSVVALEVIDSHLIEQAKRATINPTADGLMHGLDLTKVQAINLIEFASDDAAALSQKARHALEDCDYSVWLSAEEDKIDAMWEVRRVAVELISQLNDRGRHPVPFIEDTAVHPDVLSGYLVRLVEILDHAGLHYGMYGHVDSGCVHVRPAINLTKHEDKIKFLEMNKAIIQLNQKYEGVFSGEHGLGYKSTINQAYLGDPLIALMSEIKTIFDPHHQLNPRKVALPRETDQSLVKIDEDFRAIRDSKIGRAWRERAKGVVACNGNGKCFDLSEETLMCPSYKLSKDRVHSPKGRAALIRHWFQLVSESHLPPQIKKENTHQKALRKLFSETNEAFHTSLMDTLNKCLGCKACVKQCPMQVNIPEAKSMFLSYYYLANKRPLRSRLIAEIERILPWQQRYEKYFTKSVLREKVQKYLGWTRIAPTSQQSLASLLEGIDVPYLNHRTVFEMHVTFKKNAVVLVQDAFTRYYEPELVRDIALFLKQIGLHPVYFALPLNGKPYHTEGLVQRFKKIVKRNSEYFKIFDDEDVPVVGIEPSMTLAFRDEYQRHHPRATFKVALLQEWLEDVDIPEMPQLRADGAAKEYYLFQHCSEKALVSHSNVFWQKVFERFGVRLHVQSLGCCGMAGSYGLQESNVKDSQGIFQKGWQAAMEQLDITEDQCLATGYSCRSQVKRFTPFDFRHPIQALLYDVLTPVS